MKTVTILIVLIPLWWLSIKAAEAIGRHEAVQAACKSYPEHRELIREFDW